MKTPATSLLCHHYTVHQKTDVGVAEHVTKEIKSLLKEKKMYLCPINNQSYCLLTIFMMSLRAYACLEPTTPHYENLLLQRLKNKYEPKRD